NGPPTVLPAYRRIAADLQRAIAAGELAPGDLVPSEAMLTREYGVSRGTVRQALSVLVSQGLVRAVHGKGRFVQTAAASKGD
ncbi:MAG TPA: GntR family transcriptional regulator, partial [Pseudonocardiaceae bacterium]|nr:GntR family transcriptional regulator [Pseudonocardiaceae bacterium]